MNMTSKYENSKIIKEHLKTPDLIEKVFPWLSEFNKIIRSSTGSRDYQYLEESLLLYTQNICSSISSNIKFDSEIIYSNLKNHINNMLIFFHFYWFDIKQDIADHSSYLNKMSALLNIYIDIELQTPVSSRKKNNDRDSSKIAARIFTALYIYLNNSEEHIFKVLLRIKNMEKYTKICNHIFMKSFTNLKTKMTSITDVAYVRYLLAFKMWKKMEETSDKKKKINELAIMLLGSHMPELRDELKFVPKPPKNERNETPWLLHANLKHTLDRFLLYEDKIDNFGDLQRTKMVCINQSSSKFQKRQINSVFCWSNSSQLKQKISKQKISKDHINNLQSYNISSIDQSKSLKKNKKKAGKIKHKQNEIIIIDITGDEEKSKIKRKKIKLGYLRIMEENIKKNKKHINHLKSSSQLIAANKKSSNKCSKSSVKNICVEYKPISDNKASNSTKSYISNGNRSSLNSVYCIDLQEGKVQQHGYNSHYMKSPMFGDQNIKEIKVTANVLNKSKPDNNISHHVTYVTGNVISSYSNPVMQSKEVLTSQEESAMETISLFKMCQNSNADQHCFKQELPTNTDCNVAQKTYKCITVPVDVHVDVYVNHIDERIMSMHTEKIVQCLDKSNDICTVSTTFNGDQIVEPTVYSQHFDNVRMNDYGNVAKYSETTMKEQEKNDCDSSILNDQIHSSEPCTYDINSFEIGLNTEVDYELKNSPKVEMDDITNTDYFFNNSQSETLEDTDYFFNNSQSETLEDILRQSSADMSQVNYDYSIDISTKKSHSYIDNNIAAIKTHDTLHNIFNDNESSVKQPYDANINYMFNDHDKYVYGSNHTDECVMTTNAERKVEYVDNSNDMCTVSTLFTEDQIVGSSWNDQYVNFDNKRKYHYEDNSSNSKVVMKKQQERSDISISNDRLHSSEFCAFDIDAIEIDSKEDCIDDSENIDFSHNIQIETLGNVLSNDTNDFLLLLKQSPHESDTICTDTFSNKKNVLCSNQNDAIDSNVEPVAFCLNNGNTFLRLPAKSDKSMFQEVVKFRYSS